MRVLTIAMARDEAALIPYFVRHYMPLGDVTIFDDSSTDDTASVARAEGATVLPVEGQEQDHIEHRIIRAKDHAWKPVRRMYDWVIAVDVDEFLYHDDLIGGLHWVKDHGFTVVKPHGYQMTSTSFPQGPTPITDQIRRGVPEGLYSKPCCFNPQQVMDINYCVGAHFAAPDGHVQIFDDPSFKLLHYHYIGLDWIIARHANRVRWQSQYEMPEGWCTYKETPEELAAILAKFQTDATEII